MTTYCATLSFSVHSLSVDNRTQNNRMTTFLTCQCCSLSLAGAATSIIFVATKVCLSRQTFFCPEKLLSGRTYFCCDKTVFCSDKHVFVAKKSLSRQKLYLWQLSPMLVLSLQRNIHSVVILFCMSSFTQHNDTSSRTQVQGDLQLKE